MSRRVSPKTGQAIAFTVLRLAAITVVIPIFFVVAYIVYHGIGAINWSFLTKMPRDGMQQGGTMPAVVSSVILTFATATAAIPLALAAATYLAEYATDSLLT